MHKEYNFWVYILTNWKRSVLYIGITNDLPARLKEHYDLKGNTKSFTGRYYCYNLVYYEWHQYVLNALAREKELKHFSRAQKIELIESVNPNWTFYNRFICGHWPPLFEGR